ncbi:hypothetical protein BGX31_000784 [Mortierella sp. GBA43]|nr:hypothetical protein BGX31_000784 [Mortierella sp. GBA43]
MIVPVIYPGSSGYHNRYGYRPSRHRYGQRHCCEGVVPRTFPPLRTVLTWLFALGVIAAIGVTFWLTRNIPFGTNCGNTHRGLLGVLIVIVVGGIVMPLYYKHVLHDLIRKDIRRQHEAMNDPNYDPYSSTNSGNRKRKSVLASERFRFALKLSTVVLLVVIGLGYYYLWSPENRCEDPELWIVRGWFFALLVVAVVVMGFMLASMFRAVKERHLLNTARYKLDQPDRDTPLNDLEANGQPVAQAAPAKTIPSPSSSIPAASSSEAGPSSAAATPHLAPPKYPGSPDPSHRDKLAQVEEEMYQRHSLDRQKLAQIEEQMLQRHSLDRHKLAQIEEQMQQRHPMDRHSMDRYKLAQLEEREKLGRQSMDRHKLAQMEEQKKLDRQSMDRHKLAKMEEQKKLDRQSMDRHKLAQMEENMAEQMQQQQQHQRHQFQAEHTQAPYGASGTGPYC